MRRDSYRVYIRAFGQVGNMIASQHHYAHAHATEALHKIILRVQRLCHHPLTSATRFGAGRPRRKVHRDLLRSCTTYSYQTSRFNILLAKFQAPKKKHPPSFNYGHLLRKLKILYR